MLTIDTQTRRPELTPGDQMGNLPLVQQVLQNNPPEALRRAVDRIATMRAQILRIGLYSTLLCRPFAEGAEDPTAAVQHLALLEQEVEAIQASADTLARGVPLAQIDPTVCIWFSQIAAGMPEVLRLIQSMVQQASDLTQSIRAQQGQPNANLNAALTKLIDTAQNSFFKAVTQLCDAFWTEMALANEEILQQANNTANTLGEKLKRLERIGKHVRLVSLNASVEASRAGDVGKGLMVIAAEFKSLAEEIQSLANEARADMQSDSS